ncbi:hypothetical protein JCM6882_007813, partial [Rhodosporidiobolus microsporus]
SACNQTQLVLQAIQDTKVNMTVFLGAYVGDNTTVNAEQQEFILDALKLYGADNVGGVSIGNEYILQAPDRSSTTAAAITYIKEQIVNFNESLLALNLGKHVPVGTADAGSAYTADLATGIDFFMANVHPWFGGVPIDEAAGWTWDFFEQNDVVISDAAPNQPTTYIAETGWPTDAMLPENMTLGAAVAGVSELQTFLDTYPCQANKNESYYFYFEPFDEPWKERYALTSFPPSTFPVDLLLVPLSTSPTLPRSSSSSRISYGGVEPHWGLFDSNKVLKTGITFPTCDVDSSHSSG